MQNPQQLTSAQVQKFSDEQLLGQAIRFVTDSIYGHNTEHRSTEQEIFSKVLLPEITRRSEAVANR